MLRIPHEQRPGRRMQELRGYGTTTAQLLEMVAWLRHWRVQRVVMESTSTYWKGVYYLLEAEGFECWLVNALFSGSILGWVALATTEGHPCWVPLCRVKVGFNGFAARWCRPVGR